MNMDLFTKYIPLDNIYLSYLGLILFSFFAYLLTRYVILRFIVRIFEKTSTDIDDILIQNGFLNRISYAIPLLIIYNFSTSFYDTSHLFSRLVVISLLLVFLLSINSFITSINDIYSSSRYANRLSIKSYLQVLKLIINLLGVVTIIAVLSGQSPFYLLSGIGALTAVLVLVFKDTLLSFVSSIQISSNDLFKVGDWVEAPQFGADGDVIDIALHTVKIQNWDKTISIIPTHKLIDSSFKNWRGMSESGGRRIKRSINIDMNSIKFCDSQMLNRFRSFNSISDYIDTKLNEINKHNASLDGEGSLVNGRSLTNIGTYRAYIKAYLRNHPDIHKDLTFLIRQLSPGPDGLPIEIYVFSSQTNWIEYESIQSDIFDHLLAIAAEFNLKVFQNPTGNDFRNV